MTQKNKHCCKSNVKPIFAVTIMKKQIVIGFAVAFIGTSAWGQSSPQISRNQLAGQLNTVTTMVPFLTITPDSRSAGLGDAGVALFAPDANSVSWNMANLVNAEKKTGISLSYAPWLRNLVPDVGFSYLSAYTLINDGKAVIGGAFRYFSLGNINFTDFNGDPTGNFNPNELSVELGGALKFNKKLSMGVNLRYIYSNISGGRGFNGVSTNPGTAVAGDVNLLYRTKIGKNSKDQDFNFGVNIQNIGSKMTYTTKEQRDFIPTNLKLGIGFKKVLDQYNKVGFYLDVNKLLVPTRPVYFTNYQGGDSVFNGNKVIYQGKDPNVGTVQGMVQSFYDAPGGFAEELREWNTSFGIEYWYNNRFSARVGNFYEAKTKGGRQYLTFGLGVKYEMVAIDVAMLVPFFKNHPLSNQLRFSLLFDINAVKEKTE